MNMTCPHCTAVTINADEEGYLEDRCPSCLENWFIEPEHLADPTSTNSKENTMAKPLYSPADSLRYVQQASPLDYLEQFIFDQFADDNDEFEDERIQTILDCVRTTQKMLSSEIKAHNLSGALYSNGVPLLTNFTEPAVDDEGNQYVQDYAAANHPGTGRPYEPTRKEVL
ncbi:hypothetical protein [Corynebacterium hindlerae]|uniref:hypothetical protein n=1 Tax=Corynebacterium hindlerae TaxID=699041 RepID=UPI003AAD2CB7